MKALVVFIISTIVTSVTADGHVPASELRGLWVGNEKFLGVDESGNPVAFPYCSKIIFNSPGALGGLLDWHSAEAFCPDAGFDIFTGEFTKNWFAEVVLPEHFYETVDDAFCLEPDDERCDPAFVLPDSETDPHNFDDGWEIAAKSCGSNTKKVDITRGGAFCDLWMVILMTRDVRRPIMREGKKGKKGRPDKHSHEVVTEKLLVMIDTYGTEYDANDPTVEPACPSQFAFRDEDMIGNTFGIAGSAQTILQQAFPDDDLEPIDLYDPCNWDCFHDREVFACDE